ncbi:hypothetical protein [Actinomadura rupiterrae]|uniref:hypothetical protein n=1 Tax=Actinomadura rupiterrae TaxID=559627 RepID=UPI0020A33D80|nr:hypothetical protein [Actinomadura rupiterrae]MCP2342015.1 hypothetical protein [Actinomadura rupiterrae]
MDEPRQLQVPDADIRRALHLTRTAYVEAMREHGLLPGVIKVIDALAEQRVEEVLSSEEEPLSEDGPA